MEEKMTQEELDEKIRERFKDLPKVVQDTITSADVEKQLRTLADTRKLHIDQWQLLENNVMLTLLGFQEPDDLTSELKKDLGIPDELALSLTEDISRIVFKPIRQELERELGHPAAEEAAKGDVEKVRDEILAQAPAKISPAPPTPTTPPVVPATPPQPTPSIKAVRAPISEQYQTGQTSTERKNIHDDPYREPPA